VSSRTVCGTAAIHGRGTGRCAWHLVPCAGLTGLLLATALAAVSEGAIAKTPAAFAQLAYGEDTMASTLGLQWHPGWHYHWPGGPEGSVYLEAEVGRWEVARPHRHGAAWVSQWSVVPVFRWKPQSAANHYLEVGIGAAWVAPVYRRDDKQFSSRFQFRDHVALGWFVGHRRQWEVSLRVQHFSNAGIEQPNPGINMVGLRLAFHPS
jgi:lipid A 3-O-deacylase